MDPVYFQDEDEFRKWLEENHDKESEVVVIYYKVGTEMPSMTWSRSVDQAICFGWIDGIRRSIDGDRYSIRFTPRKPASVWSNINIKKVEKLNKLGLMKKAGLDAYNNRRDSKSGVYGIENRNIELDENLGRILLANTAAWDFFSRQAPSYQRLGAYWIMSAKQEATRLSRLNKMIAASEKHTRLF